MIIDFHTHCFNDKISDKALAVLENNAQQKAKIGPKLSDLELAMTRASIDISVVLNITTNVPQTQKVNDFAISLLANPKIIPFGSVHPDDPNYLAKLERLKASGIKGIKLHPHYQKVYIDHKKMIEVTQAALDMDFVVVFHAGVDTGLRDINYAQPVAIRRMLEATHNHGKIVLAHLGGYENYDDVEKYLVGSDVYLDTSFIWGSLPQEQLLRIIKNHGVDKILFGTDSPWVDTKFYVEKFSGLPLEAFEIQQIMGGNAQRLLGL